jgi:predicted ribosomally synthesized peptide with SipW-like signal peptide
MGTLTKFNPIARAVGVMGVVAALATGVTFAAFSSTATLTDNTISAADANLLVWDGDSFESTAPGFTIADLVPGEGSTDNMFYLQNNSGGALYVSAHVPDMPDEPEGGYGFTGWENLKVTFKSYAPDCEEPEVNTTMAALLAGNVELPCNTLAEGAQGNAGEQATEGNYSVSYDIDPSSLNSGVDDAGVGDFDLQLIGSFVAPTTTPETPPTETPEI